MSSLSKVCLEFVRQLDRRSHGQTGKWARPTVRRTKLVAVESTFHLLLADILVTFLGKIPTPCNLIIEARLWPSTYPNRVVNAFTVNFTSSVPE